MRHIACTSHPSLDSSTWPGIYPATARGHVYMLWPRTKHHTAINGSSTQKQTTMFGTLVCDLQHEPLTFVENTDPASALSRNRRDKPHASCELCRARKVSVCLSCQPWATPSADHAVDPLQWTALWLRPMHRHVSRMQVPRPHWSQETPGQQRWHP